jgi:acyl-CoA thioesterase I
MRSPALRSWLFSVALTLTLTHLGCTDKARHAALPQGATVVALGDSLTYGTGATQDTSYPALLAMVSGWQVVNAGVPGETAAEGCARLPGLIEEHQPQLVLVLLGGNDFLRRMPESDVVDALQRCVESARASRAGVALIAVPRFGATGIANAPLYEEAGRAWNVPVLESGLASLLARSAMRADAIHLNAAGYREMAMTIAEELRAKGWLQR